MPQPPPHRPQLVPPRQDTPPSPIPAAIARTDIDAVVSSLDRAHGKIDELIDDGRRFAAWRRDMTEEQNRQAAVLGEHTRILDDHSDSLASISAAVMRIDARTAESERRAVEAERLAREAHRNAERAERASGTNEGWTALALEERRDMLEARRARRKLIAWTVGKITLAAAGVITTAGLAGAVLRACGG